MTAPSVPAAGLEGASVERRLLVEERDFLLGSLRDLEAERAVGDLDDGDYNSLKDDYTARAACVLRRLQLLDAPALAAPPALVPSAAMRRRSRRKPAVIAMAVLGAAAMTAWALTAASGSRAPGATISGQAVGPEVVAQLLAKAQQATAKGDGVSAIKDYQQILARQPDQVEALTQEGWLLVETRQPALVSQGMASLSRALQVDPSFAPAHLYRGVALLSQGENAAAIPELQYYLDHQPDPQLTPKVRQALAQAQAAVTASR